MPLVETFQFLFFDKKSEYEKNYNTFGIETGGILTQSGSAALYYEIFFTHTYVLPSSVQLSSTISITESIHYRLYIGNNSHQEKPQNI